MFIIVVIRKIVARRIRFFETWKQSCEFFRFCDRKNNEIIVKNERYVRNLKIDKKVFFDIKIIQFKH